MSKSESPVLSDFLPSTKSASLATSVLSEKSAPQKPLSERGWEYVLESSPDHPPAKRYEVQILTSKRKRHSSRIFPMPELYSNETEEQAGERVRQAQSVGLRRAEMIPKSANDGPKVSMDML